MAICAAKRHQSIGAIVLPADYTNGPESMGLIQATLHQGEGIAGPYKISAVLMRTTGPLHQARRQFPCWPCKTDLDRCALCVPTKWVDVSNHNSGSMFGAAISRQVTSMTPHQLASTR